MYLGGVKARGRGVSYAFFSTRTLPEKLDPVTLTSLVVRLRKGDKSVVPQIVDGHIRIAMQLVSRYHAKLGQVDMCEDLLSESLLAIVKGCHDAIIKLVDNEITPYLISKIHSAISDYIARARTVAIPPSTSRRTHQTAIVIEPLQDYHNNDDVVKTLIGAELRERVCVTAMQKELVNMREAGSSDADIAKVFGVSRATVTRMRQNIGTTITQLLGDVK